MSSDDERKQRERERKRLERERKRRGVLVLRNLEVEEDQHVALLIRLGYLNPSVADIPEKVVEATAAMLAAIVTRDSAIF